MKKFTLILLISAILTGLTGCTDPALRDTAGWTPGNAWQENYTRHTDPQTPGSVPDSGESHPLSYEEIMQLPVRYEGTMENQPAYGSLDDLLLSMEQIGVPASLVCGKVTETHYYLAWDKSEVTAYTISTLTVTAVDPSVNGARLSVGDSIPVYETYSVRFSRALEELRFFASESGQELPKNQWAVLEPAVVEFLPVSNVQMVKSFAYDNWVEIPMKAGESYTFCVRKNSLDVTNVENSYLARGIACVGMSDPDAFYKDAGLNNVENLRLVAGEILERFDTSGMQS